MWDYVIVGGGPSGLSLAWYFARYNKKVLIIDKNKSLGGCHRVTRVDGLFAEHGPRIYIENYKMLIAILKDMGYDFHDFFTPYKYDTFNNSLTIIKQLNYKELFWFAFEFIRFIFDKKYSQDTTLEDFLEIHNFDKETKKYIDSICRITDGAGIDRYTLFQFLQLINQNMFYTTYQPKKPNDIGLFHVWEKALLNTNNVDIFLDTEVTKLSSNGNIIDTITIIKDGKTIDIKGENYILAIPPIHLINLLGNCNDDIKNTFGNYNELVEWSNKTEYLTYIPIIFHWNKKIKLETIWGMPTSPWGIAFIVLSDYMDFEDLRSKTVISTCITLPDNKSEYLNKTSHECTKEELIQETFRQLQEIFKRLPSPTTSILSPEIYYDDNKWHSKESAFVLTPYKYKDLKSNIFKNIYSVGTHNGNNYYNFTSFESAVTNSTHLLHELIPESKYRYPIIKFLTLENIIDLIIVIMIIAIIIYINV